MGRFQNPDIYETRRFPAVSKGARYLKTFTPLSRILFQKLIVTELFKRFLPFHETRKLTAAFTTVCHCTLSSTNWLQSIPSHCHVYRVTIDGVRIGDLICWTL
jgi:hypothetical protein